MFYQIDGQLVDLFPRKLHLARGDISGFLGYANDFPPPNLFMRRNNYGEQHHSASIRLSWAAVTEDCVFHIWKFGHVGLIGPVNQPYDRFGCVCVEISNGIVGALAFLLPYLQQFGLCVKTAAPGLMTNRVYNDFGRILRRPPSNLPCPCSIFGLRCCLESTERLGLGPNPYLDKISSGSDAYIVGLRRNT